jgi:hypothetical protein
MALPFTRDQFLEVFAAYNDELWPFAVILWVATLFSVLGVIWDLLGARFVVVLLVVHWTWNALPYHAAFFSKINPAAWFFSGLFLIEATLLLWHGVIGDRLEFPRGRSLRYFVSRMLVIYALAYPAVAWADGYRMPQSPSFGVPCPTTILTIGLPITQR